MIHLHWLNSPQQLLHVSESLEKLQQAQPAEEVEAEEEARL